MDFQLNEALYLQLKRKFQLTPKFYQWKYLSHGKRRAMTCLIRKCNFALGSSRVPKSICIIKNYQLFGFDLKAFWLLWEFFCELKLVEFRSALLLSTLSSRNSQTTKNFSTRATAKLFKAKRKVRWEFLCFIVKNIPENLSGRLITHIKELHWNYHHESLSVS